VNAVALMYHDVTPPGLDDSSGFPGGDAARYKIAPDEFAAHLRAIHGCIGRKPVTIETLFAASAAASGLPVLLTFDDGGASAEAIADRLDVFGWHGHFLVTTGYIGRPGFLSRGQIRGLRARGHIIGSHSCTHPLRMAGCSRARLREEWTRSLATLSDVLGELPSVASVPGGAHSAAVAETAADAGIRFLFTSRPTTSVRRVGDVAVIGRFAIRRSTHPRQAAAVASGSLAPRVRQLLWWDVKAIGKAVAGPAYRRLRERRFRCSGQVRWGDELAGAAEDPSYASKDAS
jgi:peptidoglycan/xylan/chitin deacetylase (PgdA/CDA1 family)